MDITTIIVTRTRIPMLSRAWKSLAYQNTAINVIIIIDDCPKTLNYVKGLPTSFRSIKSMFWFYLQRRTEETSGPKRLAQLREAALEYLSTPWCAYLDDDNELEPDHYSSLLICVEKKNLPVVHSWRSLWSRNGQSYNLRNIHPWCRSSIIGKKLFEQYRLAGIYKVNSNIVRDQVVPLNREISMVDMSEWLFKTDFLKKLCFAKTYSTEDWVYSRTEDSKLLDDIVKLGIKVPCNRKATLRYYLGGYSNNWKDKDVALNGWL